MKKFVPRAKLSKKEKRALDLEKRRTWDQPPVTRVIPGKKKTALAKKPRPFGPDGDFCMKRRIDPPLFSKWAEKCRIIC